MLWGCFSCCSRFNGFWMRQTSTGQEMSEQQAANPIHPGFHLSSALGQLISEWQTVISEFEELETLFREKFGGDIDRKMLLEEMLVSTSTTTVETEREQMIRHLATKWRKAQQYELRLPISPDKYDLENNTAKHSITNDNTEPTSQTSNNSSGMFGLFSRQVSSTWTKRLNAIDPTEGAVRLANANARGSADSVLLEDGLQIRPRWPRDLGDVTFDIIKVNKYGGRMTRMLQLTQHHVVSIRDGALLTKFYAYRDIRRAFIVQLSEGPALRVIQRSGKVNTYISPVAVHIFQQVVTRVRVRRALDNSSDFFAGLVSNSSKQKDDEPRDDSIDDNTIDGTNNACQFTVQFTAEIIKQISEANASAVDDVMAAFASELSQRSMRSIVEDDEEDIVVVDENNGAPPSSPKQRKLQKTAKQRSSTSMKALRMREVYNAQSPEAAVYQEARRILFDQNNAEATTVAHFISNFEPNTTQLSASLLQIRHFIDGLHEYCLENRAFSLAVLLQQRQQQIMLHESAQADASSGRTSTVNPVRQAPQVQSSTATGKRLIRRESLKFLKEQNLGAEQLDDETFALISLVIFLAVEECVFLSVRPALIKAYQAEHAFEELQLLQCMQKFHSRSQQEWGIPKHLVSPLGWKAAIFELSALENDLTPSAQLQVLSRTVKSIYHEFKLAVLPSLTSEVFLAADDLVPIFLFLFCQLQSSILRHPMQNRDFMWGLCHPDQLRGEAGYYLTLYESAIEFVMSEGSTEPQFETEVEEVPQQSRSRPFSTDLRPGNHNGGSITRSIIRHSANDDDFLRESFF